MASLLDDPEPGAVEALQHFIDQRRGEIEQELAAELVPWSLPERNIPTCSADYTSKITGNFSATWGTLDTPVFTEKGATFEVDVNREHRSERGLSAAGKMENGRAAFQVIAPMEDGRYLVAHFELPALPDSAPSDVPLHGFETMGVLVVSNMGGVARTTLGYIGTGAIHFDRVSTEAGAEVAGSFEAQFSQIVGLMPLSP